MDAEDGKESSEVGLCDGSCITMKRKPSLILLVTYENAHDFFHKPK